MTGKLAIQKINIEIKDKKQSDLKSFSDAEIYTFGIGPIKYDWEIMTTVSIYYILFDSLSDVGGLLALLKSALEILAPIVVLILLYDFSKVVTRKSKQKTRLFELKIILRNVVQLRGIINEKISK